ncbi:10260_t:CDS:2 [Dentiscutata erythropus]|uniref:10260_t:CDS:1 n=1 Tax=Dentiscutata erythropus TaxID=1348616 RepID=A0A9N9IAC5_9GLOM|nr:10260_t:CDS:2 [Dentiscutata erythropus]
MSHSKNEKDQVCIQSEETEDKPKAEEGKKDQPKAEEGKKDQPKAEEGKKDQPKAEEEKKDEENILLRENEFLRNKICEDFKKWKKLNYNATKQSIISTVTCIFFCAIGVFLYITENNQLGIKIKNIVSTSVIGTGGTLTLFGSLASLKALFKEISDHKKDFDSLVNYFRRSPDDDKIEISSFAKGVDLEVHAKQQKLISRFLIKINRHMQYMLLCPLSTYFLSIAISNLICIQLLIPRMLEVEETMVSEGEDAVMKTINESASKNDQKKNDLADFVGSVINSVNDYVNNSSNVELQTENSVIHKKLKKVWKKMNDEKNNIIEDLRTINEKNNKEMKIIDRFYEFYYNTHKVKLFYADKANILDFFQCLFREIRNKWNQDKVKDGKFMKPDLI